LFALTLGAIPAWTLIGRSGQHGILIVNLRASGERFKVRQKYLENAL
jgi:hypothetical protein